MYTCIILIGLQSLLANRLAASDFQGYFYNRPPKVWPTIEVAAESPATRIEAPPGVAADFIDDLIHGKKQKIYASIFGSKSAFLETNQFTAQAKTGLLVNPSRMPSIGKKCADCTCGVPNSNRIVGGMQVRTNKYPWIVQLLVGETFFCGGTLINDRYVLTAAHCIDEIMSTNITVRILQYERSATQTGIQREVRHIVLHEKYNAITKLHDIALLLLNDTVPLISPIRPACLPKTNNQNYDFKQAVVAGWGLQYELAEETSKVLQEVSLPILTNAQCRTTAYKSMIVESMLCAGYVKEGKRDACQGDSGGPLIVLEGSVYQLAGLVSFGYGCAQPNAPGVYTRVSKYLDWIASRTRDACYCNN